MSETEQRLIQALREIEASARRWARLAASEGEANIHRHHADMAQTALADGALAARQSAERPSGEG